VRSAEPLAGELLARCVSAILVQDYELGPDDPIVQAAVAGLVL
jgi:hypothetical protein